MTGFGKDPTNPFTNSIAYGNAGYSANRQAPFFEFVANRLVLDPTIASGMPGLPRLTWQFPATAAARQPASPSDIPGSPINFYAYFSSYGNGGYDPNDVNFPESSTSTVERADRADLSRHVPVCRCADHTGCCRRHRTLTPAR